MKVFRDMTRAQFHAALKRHGMRQIMLWIDDPQTGVSTGLVFTSKGKILRRATLAAALRNRAKEESRAA